MAIILGRASRVLLILAACAAGASAQTAGGGTTQTRGPRSPARPFVVMTARTLAEVERKLHSATSKGEELMGGEGMELRVVVQHESNVAPAAAELHDASDDVYYVLEGTATLTLGGRLEAAKEVEPGEWRGPRIDGGQTFDVKKGDLVIVPRGTPHMRSTTGKDFSMLLVKVFDKPLPAPKP